MYLFLNASIPIRIFHYLLFKKIFHIKTNIYKVAGFDMCLYANRMNLNVLYYFVIFAIIYDKLILKIVQ